MTSLVIDENINIENMIYEVRGKQVMLDSDLAKLYHTETKRINESVRRNEEKFPERFSFILNDKESEELLVANCDQKNETRGGKYKNPRVFTEQGVAMLATILKTKIATETSIAIMDAFVLMRKYLSNSNYDKRLSNVETKLIDYDNKFDEIFDRLDKTVNNHIFFEGQIYDAYSLLLDIFKEAKENIIIIDNYIDKKILDVISKLKCNITIITSNKLDNMIIEKYNSQYSNLNIVLNKSFHDRFIIIDNNVLYHSGASFKDLGKKCFAINRVKDEKILLRLIDEIYILCYN